MERCPLVPYIIAMPLKFFWPYVEIIIRDESQLLTSKKINLLAAPSLFCIYRLRGHFTVS